MMNAILSDRLNRIKWRSRRGLLELDIIFTRFFAQVGDSLTAADLDLLEAALRLPDNDLLDMVMERQPVADASLKPLIERLAAV
jgi:succinate dehydrogenase flavin-adding protein (antitoxin of CptAB toxin-antitoxin module)